MSSIYHDEKHFEFKIIPLILMFKKKLFIFFSRERLKEKKIKPGVVHNEHAPRFTRIPLKFLPVFVNLFLEVSDKIIYLINSTIFV